MTDPNGAAFSMVLLYMVTWIPSTKTPHQEIGKLMSKLILSGLSKSDVGILRKLLG